MFSTGEPWVRQLAATLTLAASSRCVSQIPVCAVAGQPPLLEHGEGREAAAQPGDCGGGGGGSLRGARVTPLVRGSSGAGRSGRGRCRWQSPGSGRQGGRRG